MKKYVTDIANDIWYEEELISDIDNIDETVEVKDKISFFEGMGGALTQASTVNYQLLNNKEEFIKAYFEELNYKFIRLPIGSCDFSPISYDYLVDNKFDINKDKELIHPLLNDIKKYNLTYMASPWSPPKKWKNIFNKLKKNRYSDYADYLVSYINYYKDYGIDIKYISMQNEPYAYQIWESCVWNDKEQKEFIKLLADKLDNTSIMIHDHNKGDLLNNIDNIFIENDKVNAIAFHWYDGNHFDELKKVHNKYLKLKLIESEMCCGYSKYNSIEWIKDAELYANEIMGNINNYMNIYVDWNLLLDMNGGPNHKYNYVKAPILRDDNKIIKTPIYYYLKHISLHQNSNIYEVNSNKLKVIVSDNYITILNNSNEDISFQIKDIKDKIKKHSIISYAFIFYSLLVTGLSKVIKTI